MMEQSAARGERAIRDWIRHLEQDWNRGDADACIRRLHAEAEYADLRSGRRVGRERLGRWLRFVARTTPGSQSSWVIESVVPRAADSVSVVAHVQVRYSHSEQVQEDKLSLRLVLKAQAAGWTIVTIQRTKRTYDSFSSISSL
jgi:hypothetical protein